MKAGYSSQGTTPISHTISLVGIQSKGTPVLGSGRRRMCVREMTTLNRTSESDEMEITFATEDYDGDQIYLESTHMAVVQDKLPRDVLIVSLICMCCRISMLGRVHSDHDGEP
ncbi:hypothetical protein MHU86_17024 [Fragilaria crotonensis]|nr:hypothetical protein MHU86_17024 [Fragilaria crotonensis]